MSKAVIKNVAFTAFAAMLGVAAYNVYKRLNLPFSDKI